MNKLIVIVFAVVAAVGCAPASPCAPESPCAPVRPAYNEARERINAPGLDCADGFESFGCGWYEQPTQSQLDACEAAFAALDAHSSCATLQNTLYTCEGGM